MCLVTQSCVASKAKNEVNCSRQYDYSSKMLSIKGISTVLKKSGADFANIGLSEITIDPKNVVASEKLQQLDLLQFALCQQIRSLPKNDSTTIVLQSKYISTLIDMMITAQDQNSASKR